MPAPLAHVVSEGAVVSEFVHAVGGVHHALALAAAGCVAMHRRGDPRTDAGLFAAALAAGLLVSLAVGGAAGGERLGAAAVLAFGGVLVVLRWAPGWSARLVAVGFGACYGLVQTRHLLDSPDAAGVGTVVAVAVAAAGSYAVGLTLGWVAADARATRRTAAALGAAMLLAVSVPLLVR